jgi:hypothetical protein
MTHNTVDVLHWDRYGVVWRLDVETGAAEPTNAETGHGFLWQPTVPAVPALSLTAMYSVGGILWFQYGRQRWDLSRVTVDLERSDDGAAMKFTLRSAGLVELELAYTGVALDPLNMIDPTFDAADEEQQDMFVFLARMQPDHTWVEAVTEGWGQGMRARR